MKSRREIKCLHVMFQELNIVQLRRRQFSGFYASAPKHRLGIINPNYRMSSCRECDGYAAGPTAKFKYLLGRRVQAICIKSDITPTLGSMLVTAS